MQAVQLLGVKADELAPLKEAADKDDLEALLKRCQFTQWVMRVQTRTRRVRRLSSVAPLPDAKDIPSQEQDYASCDSEQNSHYASCIPSQR